MPTPFLNVARAGPRGRPPAVLLHALSLDLTYWDGQFGPLSADRDVVAADLPGHGRSSGDPAHLSFDNLADAIAGMIASLSAGPADIVGLSVGSMIAQTLALRHPALVRSMTLIGAAATYPEPGRAAIRSRAASIRAGDTAGVIQTSLDRWFTPAFRQRRPDVVDRVTKTVLGDDPTIHAAMWETVAGLDLIADLPTVRCPTRLIVGTADTSTPPSAARAIADAIPGADVDLIEGAAHLCPIEAPEPVTRLLARFLDEVDRR